MSQHALGFDVGLSGVRATVVREDGSLVAGARRDHARAHIAAGIGEHDPADWLDGMAAAGSEAVARAGAARIAAVGVAALGPAPVLVDVRLRPLTKALLFGLDRRSEPQRRRMLEQEPAEHAAVTLSGRTERLVVVEEGPPQGGYAAEVVALAVEAAGPVAARRVTMPDLPIPFAPSLEKAALPGAEDVLGAVRELL